MKTHKKTPAFKLYAAPVVLLLMASALATPSATAETAPRGYRVVQAELHYNPSAPAEQIYAKLRRLAQRMCTSPGIAPLSLRKVDETCIAQAMQSGIGQIGRVDLAALHSRTAG